MSLAIEQQYNVAENSPQQQWWAFHFANGRWVVNVPVSSCQRILKWSILPSCLSTLGGGYCSSTRSTADSPAVNFCIHSLCKTLRAKDWRTSDKYCHETSGCCLNDPRLFRQVRCLYLYSGQSLRILSYEKWLQWKSRFVFGVYSEVRFQQVLIGIWKVLLDFIFLEIV